MTRRLRPVIGVTSYLEPASMGVWHVEAVFLPTSYILPLQAAGATIVVLPPQSPDDYSVDGALDGIDGLCVSGGYDVDPASYGQPPHPATDAPRAQRDAWETALVRRAHPRGIPFLGVCRGAQVLNVARGGTLYQHVPDVVGHEGYQGEDGVFPTMPVAVEPGTLLASIHPALRDVPVYHHQAIDAVGHGLAVCARGLDGLVEAVEDPSLAFCVATQWHPEQDLEAVDLYAAFVAAAVKYAAVTR